MNAPATVPPGHSKLPSVLILFVCAMLSALAGWAVLEPVGNMFRVSEENTPNPGATPAPLTDEALAAEAEVVLRKVAAQYAAIGLITCALLGVGMGVASRSTLGAIAGLLAGAVLGGGLGLVAGLASQQTYLNLPVIRIPGIDLEPEAIQTMISHASAWATLSIAIAFLAGIATGKGGNVPRGLGAGLMAAIIAGSLFSVLATAILPLSHPEHPVPRGGSNELVRILWIGLWSGIVAIALGRMLRFGKEPAPVATEAAPAPVPATT